MAGGSLDQSRQRFADRFEPDDDGYIFRANLKSPGVQVTADERNRFVAEFDRRLGWVVYGSAGLVVVITTGVLAALVFFTPEGGAPDWLTWLMVFAMVPVFMLPTLWIWNAPDRAFKGRVPIDAGRDAATARKLAFQRMSWRHLGWAGLAFLVLIWRVSTSYDVLGGWGRLWLLFFGALAALLVVQAVRKWRADRS